MNAIFKRRSIRQYTTAPVEKEMIVELVKAGMAAPSAGNEQPWHFIVIDQHRILTGIQKVHPFSGMLSSAQAGILVCGDISLEIHKGFWVQDCAAATENILIAAVYMGLGTVWLGVYPEEERVNGIKKLLNIPDHIIPFSLISIGHPAEQKAPKTNFDMSRVRYNSW
jgi:nitroreductase